jgi:CRP/FNR family transcriptional regulator, cyclic AMP receptor protein
LATKQEKLDLLGGVPLFAGLGKRDLQRIFNTAKPTEHAAGEVVLTEGQSGVGFHLIVGGEVKVITNGRTVARLGPGEFFGEMALVDDSPRMATIVAESDVSTIVISKWDFRALVKEHPELAWRLIEHLVFRVREEQSGRAALLC